MQKLFCYLISGIFLLLFSNCSNDEDVNQVPDKVMKAESAKANAFFDSCFDASLSRDPEQQTTLGIKKDDGKWTDRSDSAAKVEMDIAKKEIAALHKRIDIEKLDDQTRVSFHYFEYNDQQTIDDFKWRFHNYPVNQVDGFQSAIAAFLINKHQIADVSDAEAYIARLKGMNKLFNQVIEGLRIRDSLLIIPPKFVFPMVMQDCRNIISGQPFDNSGRRSPLYEDFSTKVYALKNVDGNTKARLVADARDALISFVKPAYTRLLAHLASEQNKETNDLGVWKLPDGKEFYSIAIHEATTSDITPDRVFQMGEEDLRRIHTELMDIMKKVEFKGKSVTTFFNFMLNNNKFYFDNSASGREAYISEANNVLNTMKNNLDRFFITVPKADVVIKPLDAYQHSGDYTFYEEPSPDGSKPGICYISLANMHEHPIYQIESMVYYEAIPGYHMEVSSAMELKNIPKFRKYGRSLSYDEGWALYAQYFPKEYGFYTDPYSDYGRLAAEALHAAASVIDVGLHYKKWTKEGATNYLLENAPYSENEARREVERCLVSPAQATGYKIGMSKIVQLRERAKKSLGKKFDLRKFHDAILTNGPLPLSLLEDNVNFWINDQFGK